MYIHMYISASGDIELFVNNADRIPTPRLCEFKSISIGMYLQHTNTQSR